ncbi:morphogenetic protein [Klebsiella pneumoniae]|uniref:morphogenetic protein n=1 Tax=Klebsiella pneumoniae TaxID=573 RepID=UPI00200FD0C3|nr:morphogenetic protein [Klebsiella pneumoniae]MCL0347981.1 morphogenetic protein [Klebsiella pneumoniae]
MKERGMIFNYEMVRAILDGRKTQTRRIMKVQPVLNGNFYEVFGAAWSKGMKSIPAVPGHSLSTRCPFGAVGDRIWVRETFCPVDDTQYGGEKWVDYRATPKFEASHPAGWDCAPNDAEALKWRPSIHMPRWASRILLEITDVRVERLNSISQEDAQAEGLELTGWRPTYSDPDSGGEVMTPYDNFAELWSSIYGDESWQANPWVWVIEFKRVEGGAA